jgi:putative copper export protein
VLTPAIEGIRLTLHVLAAAIWVGGQLTLGGLVPSLRRLGSEATAAVTKAFGRLAWPAYAVLLITGLWNYSSFNMNKVSLAWKIVVGIKITVALLAGVAAYLHQRAKSKAGIAAWGGISGITSVAALALGVFLAG